MVYILYMYTYDIKWIDIIFLIFIFKPIIKRLYLFI